jgi:HPt (histidine-containing phosphotransfer) domain-containing protein
MVNEVIPEALRRRYLDSFPDKRAALEAASANLVNHDAEAQQGLRQLAHKLAGSAGMYGFDDIGQLAREVVHAIDAGASVSIISALSRDLASRLAGADASLQR